MDFAVDRILQWQVIKSRERLNVEMVGWKKITVTWMSGMLR